MPDTDHVVPKALKELADRADQFVNIRTLPRPPLYLQEDAYSSEQAVALVAPHWNSAVEVLESGPSGYSALVQLHDRLVGHLQSVTETASWLESRSVLLDRVLDALHQEMHEHGADTEVYASLGENPATGELAEWRWMVEKGRYVLERVGRYVDEIWRDHASRIQRYRVVYPHETWGDALSRTTSAYERTEQRLIPLDHRRDLVRFRLEVMEQVLKEYELLGLVKQLEQDSAPRSLSPPDIDDYTVAELLFVVAAYKALEQDPSCKVMSTGIFAQVDERLEDMKQLDEVGETWYEGKAIRVAQRPRIRAYTTTKGEGTRPGKEEAKREDLEERVTQLAKELGEAGVKSIQDVLDLAH